MFKSRLAALTITTALTSLTVFAQEDYTRLKSEGRIWKIEMTTARL